MKVHFHFIATKKFFVLLALCDFLYIWNYIYFDDTRQFNCWI